MSVVNEFFRRYYPAVFDDECWEYDSMLGGMRRYRQKGVETIFPEVVCADGLRMSVQGHAGAYSSPRDDFADEYSAVEILAAPGIDELLAPFAQDPVGDNVLYPYVPAGVVDDVIARHGGLAS